MIISIKICQEFGIVADSEIARSTKEIFSYKVMGSFY